jgi:hypothetical protein
MVRRALLNRFAVALSLALLYVPSVGPAVFLEAVGGAESPGDSGVVGTVYWPVGVWLRNQYPRTTYLHEYISWWSRLGKSVHGQN